MNFLFTFLQPIYNDAPEPWQIGFQDGASPGFEGITELHDSIFFFLVVISVGVFWALGSVMINFNSTSSPIVYKYANHGFKFSFLINNFTRARRRPAARAGRGFAASQPHTNPRARGRD